MIVVNGHLPLVLFDIEVSFKCKLLVVGSGGREHAIAKNYWSLRMLSKFS